MQNNNISGKCYIGHLHWGQRKTARPHEAANSPVECDEYGIWHINSLKEARTVLRSSSTRQAGFGADLLKKTSAFQTLVFMEREEHQQYRKQIARFFTPKVVNLLAIKN